MTQKSGGDIAQLPDGFSEIIAAMESGDAEKYEAVRKKYPNTKWPAMTFPATDLDSWFTNEKWN